jgi:uncharacterized membrane protein
VIAVLGFIGLCVAIYLSLDRAGVIKEACPIKGDPCHTVQGSKWGELAGIKVAYIGTFGYAMILLSLLVKGENGRLLTVALAIPGWAFAAYLTYRELFDVKQVCPYCMTSFAVLTIIMILSIWRMLRGEGPIAAVGSDAVPQELQQ